MRVASLDELHRPLQRDVIRRRKKKVDMVRHQNESMQLETALSTISIESLQEQSGVRLHDEESSPLKCRESYEVSPRRRDQSCRFHRAGPQRLKAAISCQPNAVRLEVAPFPFVFSPTSPLLGQHRSYPRTGRARLRVVPFTLPHSRRLRAFPPCAIPIVLQAVGFLFEIGTNGKGTTSSRAVQALRIIRL